MSVWSRGSFTSHRCRKKVWKDGYCVQHHPSKVVERQKKKADTWEKKRANSPLHKLELAQEKLKATKGLLESLYVGKVIDEDWLRRARKIYYDM